MKIRKIGQNIPLSMFKPTRIDLKQQNTFMKRLSHKVYDKTKRVGWIFDQLNSNVTDGLVQKLKEKDLLCTVITFEDGEIDFCLVSDKDSYKQWLKDTADFIASNHFITDVKTNEWVESGVTIDPSVDIEKLIFGMDEKVYEDEDKLYSNSVISKSFQFDTLMDETVMYVNYMIYIGSVEDIKSACEILVNQFIKDCIMIRKLEVPDLFLMSSWIQFRSLSDFTDSFYTLLYIDIDLEELEFNAAGQISLHLLEEWGMLRWEHLQEIVSIDENCLSFVKELLIYNSTVVILFAIIFSNMYRKKIKEVVAYEV